MCNDLFIENFLASVTVKEFRKSDNIRQSCGQELGVFVFFDTRCIYFDYTQDIFDRYYVNSNINTTKSNKTIAEQTMTAAVVTT